MGPPAPVPLGSKTPASYKTPAPAPLSDQVRVLLCAQAVQNHGTTECLQGSKVGQLTHG
jgi:hypothetical protein